MLNIQSVLLRHCKFLAKFVTVQGSNWCIKKMKMTSNLFSFFSQFDIRRQLFDVSPDGTVYVKNGTRLDRESISSYSPTLQALDSGNKTGSTVVIIEIKDINDETPEMNRDIYEAYVKENSDLELQIKVTLWI